MTVIQSTGGPFIALDRASAPKWGGVAACRFFRPSYNAESDYEVLCGILDQPNFIQQSVVSVQPDEGKALILTMPLTTGLLYNTKSQVFIIQVHYSEPSWDIEALEERVLMNRFLRKPVIDGLDFFGGDLVIFDSSEEFRYSHDEVLSANLAKGKFSVKYDLFNPDETTLVGVTQISICRQ